MCGCNRSGEQYKERRNHFLEVAHELEFTPQAPMIVKWVLEIEPFPENVEHQLGGPWARLEDLRGV